MWIRRGLCICKEGEWAPLFNLAGVTTKVIDEIIAAHNDHEVDAKKEYDRGWSDGYDAGQEDGFQDGADDAYSRVA